MVAHDIDPRSRISDLTRTEKSLVAIARALGVRAQVLVLDEPTASLPQSEVELLFRVLRRLRADGVSMIYVSHRLDEVFAISDSLVVLRDGKLVDARPTSEAEPETLIASIIGRRPESVFVRPPAPKPTPLLTCEGVCIGDVGPVSFTLHAADPRPHRAARGRAGERRPRAARRRAGHRRPDPAEGHNATRATASSQAGMVHDVFPQRPGASGRSFAPHPAAIQLAS